MAMLAAIEHRPFDNYPIVRNRKKHPEISTKWKGKIRDMEKLTPPEPDLIDIDQDLD